MIQIAELRFRWRPQDALILDIPAFEIAAGERVLLTGPSGGGKTSLLNLLGGLSRPEAGEIRIRDTALTALSGARRDAFRADHIGVIFQMFNLLPYLGLVPNVLLPCRFSSTRRGRALARGPSLEAEARRLLAQMALDPERLARRPVTGLSVGQQQRVAAARALIGSPDLVIADEPTSALDADARRDFLDLLFEEVAETGATLLFVSHDLRLRDVFDRMVALAEINRAEAPA